MIRKPTTKMPDDDSTAAPTKDGEGDKNVGTGMIANMTIKPPEFLTCKEELPSYIRRLQRWSRTCREGKSCICCDVTSGKKLEGYA